MSRKNKLRIAVTLLVAFMLLDASAATLKGTVGSITGESAFYRYMVVDPLIRYFFIYGFALHWMYTSGESFLENFPDAILANPSFNPSSPSYNPTMLNVTGVVIKTLTPFYVFAILATAFYLLFLAASPDGRANAKKLFQRLLVSMFFFSISPLILESMLYISWSMSKAILDSTNLGDAKTVLEGGIWGMFWVHAKIASTDLESAIPYWTALYVLAWLPYMMICLRYIMVTFFCMVFPLGIVLYSFIFIRKVGRQILEQLMLWTFMQVFLALVIMTIAASASFHDFFPEKPDNFVGINIAPFPGADIIFQELFNTLGIEFGSTDILSLTLGVAGYAMFFVVPLMMHRLLEHYLP